MNNATPLTSSEFFDFLLPLQLVRGVGLAVAVSGGADSMALTLLLGEYCKAHHIPLTALTVDHGLRAEAAEEAQQVAQWLKKYDIPHVTLQWLGDKPNSNIQDQARLARYKLMGQWCQKNAVSRLFLAHHIDDQAETFLMRLFRGSGVDGLSAMKRQSDFPVPLPGGRAVTICRPLLNVAKLRLCAGLTQAKQAWIEDPSNENESYTRVKVRHLLRDNEIEGLDAERMAGTAARMGRVQSLLQSLTLEVSRKSVTYHAQGYAMVSLPSLLLAHDEIVLRCLASVLRTVGGGKYAPRLKRLEALYDKLKYGASGKGGFSGQTLGGCVISSQAGNCIMVSREGAAITETVALENPGVTLWDGRFVIEHKAVIGLLKKLEQGEWLELCRENPALKKLKLPKLVRDGLPCILLREGNIILPDVIPGFDRSGFIAVFQQSFVNELAVK